MTRNGTSQAAHAPVLETAIDWRSTLTVDELDTIAAAHAHAEFRRGSASNSPLILIDKLVHLLDGESLVILKDNDK